MAILAAVLTLLLGFLAAWITLKPPATPNGRGLWTACFAIISAMAAVATYLGAREDSAQRTATTGLISSTKSKTDLLLTQNADLYAQLNKLNSTLESAALTSQVRAETGASTTCQLKSDIGKELERVNRFFKERLSKSPAHTISSITDPEYSRKEETYQTETARQYIEKFWRTVQPLLQRAQSSSITPDGTLTLATPGWYPPDQWWQAGLTPGYKELVLISQQIANC